MDADNIDTEVVAGDFIGVYPRRMDFEISSRL
jgi:hypothetical protein